MVVDAGPGSAATTGRTELPRPLADEIERDRLVEQLAQRWDVQLTVVEAAGGFGKSVAVAQAIRDNDADPSGIDVYARFRLSHESLETVSLDLVAELENCHRAINSTGDGEVDGGGEDAGGGRRLFKRVRHDPATASGAAALVAGAIADHSPVDVCVCLDDVHLAVGITEAADFVTVLLDALPTNGHLLLSGRTVDMVKRARLRAADNLIEIGEEVLAFDDAEVGALAGRHDVAVDDLARAGGWPAVTRLAVSPGFDASREFLLEELVDELPADQRRAIFVAVTAGIATADLLRACDIDVAIADLLKSVPLLVDYDQGVGAHDLWQEVADHLVDQTEADFLARRIIETLAEGDRLPEAIQIAMQHDLVDEALAGIMRIFEDGDARVTVDMVNRWVAGLGNRLEGHPEADFLAGFQLRLSGDVAEGAQLLTLAAAGFEERGDVEAETTTVKELGMSSWLLSDPEIWLETVERSGRLVASGSERMRASMRAGRIAALDLQGDFDSIFEIYQQFEEFDEIGLRHAAAVAVLVGDVAQAVEWADRLVAEFPKPLVFGQADMTYWQVGRPRIEKLMRQRPSGDLGNARNQFLTVVFASMMGTCVGRVPDIAAVDSLAWSRSREQTFVALVHAAHDLLTGSEDDARAAFIARLDEVGHDDPLLRGELMRFLPYAYVMSPDDREWIDATDLSPLHRDLRDLAHTFLTARERPGSQVGALPSHDAIVAWLPLPWSVELAVLLAEAKDERAVPLAAALSSWIGAPVHRELRRLRSRAPELARASDSILAVVPGPPDVATHVNVCSGTTLRHGGADHEVSRRRVREALQLLTLGTTWTRSALAHAIWPDLDDARAAANLRSTLRHLRVALEPSREAGEADFHLRHSDNRLSLHRSEWLDVDLWRIDDQLADAQRAEASGRIGEAIELRLGVFGQWSVDAFAESRDIEEVEGVVADAERRVIGAACWAAERQLSVGDHSSALDTARRLLDFDPMSERAHDVRVGIHLAMGDLEAAAASVHQLIETSHAIGVAPSSGSEMLIRRYERRSGRQAHQSRGASAG